MALGCCDGEGMVLGCCDGVDAVAGCMVHVACDSSLGMALGCCDGVGMALGCCDGVAGSMVDVVGFTVQLAGDSKLDCVVEDGAAIG